MAKKSAGSENVAGQHSQVIPNVPAPALLSFLKQVSSQPTCGTKDLEGILRIRADSVPQLTAMIEVLGYAEAIPIRRLCRRLKNVPVPC